MMTQHNGYSQARNRVNTMSLFILKIPYSKVINTVCSGHLYEGNVCINNSDITVVKDKQITTFHSQFVTQKTPVENQIQFCFAKIAHQNLAMFC